MLESLGPIVSLFKLLIDGLSKAAGAIKINRIKSFQRKIIEIQLSLEDILDNAQEILSYIEKTKYEKVISENIISDFKNLLYNQNRRINILLDIFYDTDSAEIMKLFTPDIRRNIINLIHMKGGFIQEILWNLKTEDDIKLSQNKVVVRIKPELLDWNHERFISEGYSYRKNLLSNRDKHFINIYEQLENQQKILNSLMECSKELSEFIKTQIDINEFFGLRK